jgi:hypothetical protein
MLPFDKEKPAAKFAWWEELVGRLFAAEAIRHQAWKVTELPVMSSFWTSSLLRYLILRERMDLPDSSSPNTWCKPAIVNTSIIKAVAASLMFTEIQYLVSIARNILSQGCMPTWL